MKIIFATTTAMNPNGSIGINPRTNDEIEHYNSIAKTVAMENEVIINDLYALTKEWDSDKYTDYCHFTSKAFAHLGDIVATRLKKYF